MTGLTFDTGALIALERRRVRARQILQHAMRQQLRITVPADVVAEWWRGPTDIRRAILDSIDVEPLSLELATVVGEALAAVRGATLVDTVVMASAASRGDVVYTGDIDDLMRLHVRFPNVRVLSV